MLRFFIIALGGAIGSLVRYVISGLDYRISMGVFPVGTLVVNVTGSFMIGCVWSFVERFAVPPNIRQFILVGILGGYTTFSTFSLETFNLIREGEYRIAVMNVVLSAVIGVGAVLLGYMLSRVLMNAFK